MRYFSVLLCDFVNVLEGYGTKFLRKDVLSGALVRYRLFRCSYKVISIISVRNPPDHPQILRIFVEVLEMILVTQGT